MPIVHGVLERFQKVFVPQRFDLAFNAVKGRLSGVGELESRRLRQLSGRFRTAIDIGANRGEYTFEMSRLFDSVWSFEPNLEVSRPIRSAKLKNVHFQPFGISSREGVASMNVPVVNGRAVDGLGSLEFDDRSDVNNRLDIQLRTLDSFNIRDVDFIKMDVEGHELNALMGAVNTIDLSRPLFLIEYADDGDPEVANFFAARGYEAHSYWNGVAISPHNRIFAPREMASPR